MMRSLKTKLAAILVGFAGLTNAAQADCWDSCNDCCMDLTIGVDWLYWTPCISDQHFGVHTEESLQNPNLLHKTEYLCNNWDSGVRIYGKLDNLWNDFNGGLFYTYINPKAKGELNGSGLDTVFFSNPVPVYDDSGAKITSDWELEYHTLDAILSYSIDVTRNPCLDIEAFSGLTWVKMKQSRTDTLYGSVGEEIGDTAIFSRELDVNAIGPTFGLNTSLRVCDCFNLFGTFQTSLVVGDSDSKDYFTLNDSEQEEILTETAEWRAKDECFCFPGLHLVAGVSYDMCVCDWTIGLRLGWEYVQWINAPAFPYSELESGAVRSASSGQNLTMQGIFVGLNASF